MAKRLTDSRKWEDPWFTELPMKFKLLWLYLLDKCDHAGIFKKNIRLAEFLIGESLPESEIDKHFNGRLIKLDSETWRIPKFIEFQYGVLNPNNRLHLSVISLLEKEGASKGLARGYLAPKDKDKRKDKDKDKDKSISDDQIFETKYCDNALEAFNTLLAEYPSKVGTSPARALFFQWQITEDMPARMQKAVANYKKHLKLNDWKKPMNFDKWLGQWLDWENYVEVLTEEQRIAELKERLRS
jgi:hypothetical protein